ncbi:hypothetical protein [Wenzhouxiangella sediminis]|uniref:Transferrin-binding protein B C-lobe/N-lobe beta barrel domain-containing protein n=1 Tax=Wenzhouxiangella sediminis TaxID=1792836 RepID=A0A3E1KAG2_9GAMM|nr:hypothetical protein [Wenzhouxiangella sediminis]RFF31262.1 hypothetical protein DZC52_05450 [Wenzhouxiangella sediminis]
MTTNKILAAGALFVLSLAPAWADEPAGVTVEELRAMSSEERRATLKALSPEKRQGLWLQAKRMDWQENRGGSGSAEGFYRDAVANLDSNANPRTANASPRAMGTITYDDGVITNSFGGGALVGNRFNTHDGGINITASGTIDTIQAVVVEGPAVTTSSAGFVIEGPQTTGGGAQAIFSTFTAGLTGSTDTVTFAGLGVNYTGSSFFVIFGDFASVYVPAFGSGSTAGQGHHGVVGYTGGMGPDITGTFDFGETLNALVRATGNILPVELIEYDVQ